jgi:hypothetical protein
MATFSGCILATALALSLRLQDFTASSWYVPARTSYSANRRGLVERSASFGRHSLESVLARRLTKPQRKHRKIFSCLKSRRIDLRRRGTSGCPQTGQGSPANSWTLREFSNVKAYSPGLERAVLRPPPADRSAYPPLFLSSMFKATVRPVCSFAIATTSALDRAGATSRRPFSMMRFTGTATPIPLRV